MIISIFGRNRSGKTTLADMLVKEYGFVKMSFADALRKIVKSYFGIDTSWKVNIPWNVDDSNYIECLDNLFLTIKDPHNVKKQVINKINKVITKYEAYRVTLELVGTEVFRNLVSKTLWVDVLIFDVLYELSKGNGVVIDDMRFDIEYEALKKLNAKFIRLMSNYEEPDNGHESQQYIEGFDNDYVIFNTGTKEDLLREFNIRCVILK